MSTHKILKVRQQGFICFTPLNLSELINRLSIALVECILENYIKIQKNRKNLMGYLTFLRRKVGEKIQPSK